MTDRNKIIKPASSHNYYTRKVLYIAKSEICHEHFFPFLLELNIEKMMFLISLRGILMVIIVSSCCESYSFNVKKDNPTASSYNHHRLSAISNQKESRSSASDSNSRGKSRPSSTVNSDKKSTGSKSSPSKKTGGNYDESLEALERQVNWKFGASKSKFDDEGDDEIASLKPAPKTRGPNLPKFTGFERKANSDKITSSPVEEVDEPGNTAEPVAERKSILLGRLLGGRKLQEKTAKEEKRNLIIKVNDDATDNDFTADEVSDDYGFDFGDEVPVAIRSVEKTRVITSAVPNSGFRLRKPPPPTEEQLLAEKKKADAVVEREAAIKAKRALKRTTDDGQFVRFDFDSPDFNAKNSSESLFSAKSFAEIGVSNPTILKNLEFSGIFNPTKVQELAVPLLQSGKDVLVQAQTGSGKTLSFLLPLVDVIDTKSKKVECDYDFL